MAKIHYYTAAATRELDRLAIEEYNIPGFELMQRAGKAAFNALLKTWPNVKKLIILCGTGNNGGDGFIIGGLAQEAGLQTDLFIAGDSANIKNDALKALDFATNLGLNLRPVSDFYNTIKSKDCDVVIVDALLGTGLTGKVREPYSDLINKINISALPVLAVDIPSGLCSDTGESLGATVKADMTVTFIGRKIGLITKSGPELVGKLVFDDLNVPEAVYAKVSFIK